MICRIVCCVALLCGLASALDRGQEFRLWPKDAPGSEGVTAPEVFQAGSNPKLPARFTVVHYPSIYAFLPSAAAANGMAIVVAPGGGHSNLVIDKEGYEIADALNKIGIAAFVLKYRLAKAAGSKYTIEKDEYADIARAMRTVRSRAKEWSVDPGRIGVMGFSAGGALAALMETRFDAGNDGSPDPVERASSRPDFAVVVYPGYPQGMVNVPKNAPPTFLVCADDDRSHIPTTVGLYMDLQKQEVSSEMHIYSTGAHGFALRRPDHPVGGWFDRMQEWMVEQKLLKR
jgi:acetyl esterase/lipase